MGEGVASPASRAEGLGTFASDEASVVGVVDSPTDGVTKHPDPAKSSGMGNIPGTASHDVASGEGSDSTVSQPDPAHDGATAPETPATSSPADAGQEHLAAPPAPMAAAAPPAPSPGAASPPPGTTPPPAEAPAPPEADAATGGTTAASADPGEAASAQEDLLESGLASGRGVAPAPAVAPGPAGESARDAGWNQPGDWQVEPVTPPVGHSYASHDVPPAQHFDEPDEYDDYTDEYDDGALFATILSAPSLALAAFVFALTGLLGGMIPESLPYLVQIDPGNGPAYHVRIIGLIALGFAIIAASLGLASMLRSIGSPLRWPRYLGGAAVLLALLIALQSVLLIVLAGLAPEQGGMN
ncbi:MAG: hypothetical protein ACRDUA_12240 [Micromonosporaceae bacterium]